MNRFEFNKEKKTQKVEKKTIRKNNVERREETRENEMKEDGSNAVALTADGKQRANVI